MSKKDQGNLLAIREAVLKIRRFSNGYESADAFFADEIIYDAVLMNFIVIGEISNRLSEQLKAKNNHIQWAKIKSFRNIVAHNYFGVDAEEVWLIIADTLPTFEKQITQILEDDENT